ncbi:MAG TPA: dTDP-4-dehydrorhamnose 3,5-epimerase family protein [Polyangia bacterium]|nr:dTDP-4-dehydrorhamnose 3,5-epimerase family protein [Polyangia bacterium]
MKLIEGVKVVPLKRIPDERGTVMHMLKATDPHFEKFGEIYFTTIYAGAIKGWHWHEEMGLNYACPHGRIKLVLFDERADSPTRGDFMELFLGPDDYSLVSIPPRVWNGMKGMSEHGLSIVANCATVPHLAGQPKSRRLDPYQNHIPYDWTRKDH